MDQDSISWGDALILGAFFATMVISQIWLMGKIFDRKSKK